MNNQVISPFKNLNFDLLRDYFYYFLKNNLNLNIFF